MTELGVRAIGSGPRIRPNAGTEVPMAHAIGREIIRTGLADREFIERATSGFEEYGRLVEPWTVSLAVKVTGVPAAVVRELARACARGEPIPAADGLDDDAVRALIDLSLLTGLDHGDRARRTPFHLVRHDPPVDLTDEEYPVRLTKGRRVDSYNTRLQRGGSASSLRRAECVELSPEDAERYGVVVGEEVRVATRRGATVAPVWVDPALRPGLAFMTGRPPDGSDADRVAARASCPIAGSVEFEAAAIRIEKTPVVAMRS
ncbi:anaerobic selenocysteine-containing dehydrogenase [Streptomyces sp. SAI-126]|nr:anaerobic selenocysteine-containing dehydrogenase [Streptomyces sp. SAI-119]MDH6495322.1 anaerobic selenocysteine-containing dehydrogenase [Streptomyces sp. SAI-149]